MTAFSADRLTYAPLTADDWPFFLALNQDRAVMKFISDARSEDEIRTQSFNIRLPTWVKGSDHWLCLVIREKSSGLPVGVSGFIDRGEGAAEVGFILSAAFQGLGYGSESLRDIAGLALNVCGFRKLTATVTAGNIASKKTLEKVGFLQEGLLRENYFLQGQWQDDWIFGLLKDELRLQ